MENFSSFVCAEFETITVASAISSYDDNFTYSNDTTRPPVPVNPVNRFMIDGKYTYESDFELKVGDEVILPSSTGRWIGTVTSISTDYTGNCKKVLQKIDSWSWERKTTFMLVEKLKKDLEKCSSNRAKLEATKGYIVKIENFKIAKEIKDFMKDYIKKFAMKSIQSV